MQPISDLVVDAKFTALTDNNELLSFSANAPQSVASTPVMGIDGVLLGIDVRPADGKIYGITTANKIYTLNPNGATSGSFGRAVTLNADEETALLSSNLYVNLHTEAFAPGELRGQVEVELENDIVARGLMLEESQQVNDVPNGPATSMFDVVYEDTTNQLSIDGQFSGLSSPLLPIGGEDGVGNPESAIHIHNGAIGANGPIVRNLTVEGERFFGSFTLTDAEEMELLNDNLYINLHTEGFAPGELRGQIDVDVEGDVVTSIALEESQQVNDVPNGPATGLFSVLYDNATNELTTEGNFSGLTGPLLPIGGADMTGNPESAIHIHQGAAGENGPIIRTLDAMDNVAMLVSELDIPFEGGTISGFDFNPAADRLRLVGDNDQDFRINVDTGAVTVDGTLAFADGDANAGVNPNITAAAYTNSFDGTTSTQLYDIDTLLNQLVLQNPPNDGVLMTIGDLGVDFDTLGGFDILSDGMGGNAAFAVSNAMLYSIDLETGAAMNLGMVGNNAQLNIQGLAVMASMDNDGMGGMTGEDNPDGMDANGDMTDAQMLFGTGADDILSGGAGNDALYGNGGSDMLMGNAGNDQLYGAAGSDRLTGGSGDDLLYGNGGEDVFAGDAGNDILFGGAQMDIMMGGSGDDILYGNGGGDQLSGDGGNDQLYGSHSDDVLVGSSGDDILYGNGGMDMLTGGSGNDLIYGGSQADMIMGGAGNDVIYANGGRDIIDSGTGMDEIWLGGASDAIITLNSGEGFAAIKNFQQGNTQLQFSGSVTYEDSSDGAKIFSGSDLLAVVAWNSAAQLQGSVQMG